MILCLASDLANFAELSIEDISMILIIHPLSHAYPQIIINEMHLSDTYNLYYYYFFLQFSWEQDIRHTVGR